MMPLTILRVRRPLALYLKLTVVLKGHGLHIHSLRSPHDRETPALANVKGDPAMPDGQWVGGCQVDWLSSLRNMSLSLSLILALPRMPLFCDTQPL